MENQSEESAVKIIETIVESLISKMGFQVQIETTEKEEGLEKKIICNVKTEESSFLIGQHGSNLDAIEHLARVLVRRKTEEKIKFILDVNFYRQEKNQAVISLAGDMAERALIEKRAVILRPMSPFERRLVHLELANNAQVTTESMGEGENRKVIIKPVGLV